MFQCAKLKEVRLVLYETGSDGKEREFTITTLSGARIISVKPIAAGGNHSEMVNFIYSGIHWNFVEGNKIYSPDLKRSNWKE
jgi:type VI protein secretion system component Hcp